ncbi:hypothetical protein WH96_20870, partial [Kiloniella spongiae]
GGGGGGGSGAFSQNLVTVTPGETISVSVGAGGAAPTYAHPVYGKNTDGNAGVESAFGTFVSASGGEGGGGAYSQHQSTGAGGAGGSGGVSVPSSYISLNGTNGSSGESASTVSGNYLYAEGGSGGTGYGIRDIACGSGGAGPKKIGNKTQNPSNPGLDGCVLVEWGQNIQTADTGPTKVFLTESGNHNWTVPEGVSSVRVTLVGAGGSGGQNGTFTTGSTAD